MAPSWLLRLRVLVADLLLGTLIYIPLSITLYKRARAPAIAWNERNIPRLDGKVAIVTGANAGIGYHTVKQLALKGVKVYLAARSESRVTAAIHRLLRDDPSIPRENLVWLYLDLSSQAQVVDAALVFRSKEDRLDILVNNAGVDPYDYVTTPDGFEMTMAVNHIGHWTFTYSLLHLLKATAAQPGSDVRVITVSSSGEKNSSKTNNFTHPEDLNDPGVGPGWENSCWGQARRYATSKRANILFGMELQRRVEAENIISVSVNPGPIRTEGAANVMPFMVRPVVGLFFDAPEKGALPTLYAAAAKEVKENSDRWKGRYSDSPGVTKDPTPKSQDAVAARDLWDTTEAAVKALGILDRL